MNSLWLRHDHDRSSGSGPKVGAPKLKHIRLLGCISTVQVKHGLRLQWFRREACEQGHGASGGLVIKSDWANCNSDDESHRPTCAMQAFTRFFKAGRANESSSNFAERDFRVYGLSVADLKDINARISCASPAPVLDKEWSVCNR